MFLKEFLKKIFGNKNKDKYKIDVKKNVPQRVYGIPNPNKYNVIPEENVPRKVYGIPNPNKYNNQSNNTGEFQTIIETAARILGITTDEASKNIKEIPDLNAWYFVNLISGDAVIINSSGESLVANSVIDFDMHVQAFCDGERN